MSTYQARFDLAAVAERTTILDGKPTPENYGIDVDDLFLDGTADGQVDEVYRWRGTISAAAIETFNLQSLTQLDDDGINFRTGISFDGIKGIAIRNHTSPSAGGYARIGENSSVNPWDGTGCMISTATGTMDLGPGGTQIWTSRAGGAVTATERDLEIAAVTADQDIEVLIVGEAS